VPPEAVRRDRILDEAFATGGDLCQLTKLFSIHVARGHLRSFAMTQAKPSRSAQNVALVRAHLTRLGVVNDPYARQMLSPDRRRTAAVFQVPGVRFRLPGVPGLAARTLFFDTFVNEALDDRTRQVVIVGAGYDSRAWRLARPGVTFFEIDQPATQDDKRAKAPEGGPVYVSADVTDPQLSEKLQQAGFQADEPTAFTLEGLIAYLAKEDAAELFARLADLATTGSRMAVSFDSGFERQRVFRRFASAYYKRAGEPWRFRLQAEDAPSFLAQAGWTMSSLLTGSELNDKHLSRTELAGALSTRNTSSFVAVAKK
jgi:methyltransferase (TIGR00027 family)